MARHLAAADGEGAHVFIQELFRRYYEKVVTWCLRIAGNRDDAGDLAQQIFVRVHRHLASFRGESKFSTWLYTICRTECLTFARLRSSRRDSPEEEALEDVEAGDPSPEDALDNVRSAGMVRSLIERELDETEKKVFTLHYGDDVSLDAITRLLGLVNRSGAKAYIVSARRKLARAVQRIRAEELRLRA